MLPLLVLLACAKAPAPQTASLSPSASVDVDQASIDAARQAVEEDQALQDAAAQAEAAPVSAAPVSPHRPPGPALGLPTGPATGPNPLRPLPVTNAAAARLVEAVQAATLSGDKLDAVRAAVPTVAITVEQTRLVLQAMSCDADKLEALTLLRPRITDPASGPSLASEFSFSSDQDAVRALFE